MKIWKVAKPVAGTRYKLYVNGLDTYPRLTPLETVFEKAIDTIQRRISDQEGAVIPTGIIYPDQVEELVAVMLFSWFNQCNREYGSYSDMLQIVKTLRDVLTVPEFMPTEHQSNRCIYAVTRVPEEGTEEARIGDGVVWGTNM